RLPLGNDDVAGKRRLEASAQAFALYQRNGGDRQAVAHVVVVKHIDTGCSVVQQAGSIPSFDQLDEQIEVSTQIENAGCAGGKHRVLNRHRFAQALDGSLRARDVPAVPSQILEKYQIKAGPWTRRPTRPDGTAYRVVASRELWR